MKKQKQLYLWLVENPLLFVGYYKSAIVVAATEEEAKKIHPKSAIKCRKVHVFDDLKFLITFNSVTEKWICEYEVSMYDGNTASYKRETRFEHNYIGGWNIPKNLTVKYIGIADLSLNVGDVLCSSLRTHDQHW